jgi:hypothetical protein
MMIYTSSVVELPQSLREFEMRTRQVDDAAWSAMDACSHSQEHDGRQSCHTATNEQSERQCVHSSQRWIIDTQLVVLLHHKWQVGRYPRTTLDSIHRWR